MNKTRNNSQSNTRIRFKIKILAFSNKDINNQGINQDLANLTPIFRKINNNNMFNQEINPDINKTHNKANFTYFNYL